MTKKFSTKKSLVASIVAIVICFTMLLGTTFAWFTDSALSEGNIIQAGNLDVEMYWADGTQDVPAADSADWIDASTGAIFDYDLWEPGYVEVRHIKIENKGSLALKYMIKIVANGEVSELADVIDVYYADPAVKVADRTDLTEANRLGTLTEVLADLPNTASGKLLAGENDTITLALKMQEEAGNKYKNKSLGTTFSVQLLATQLTAESDSFDDQYDADAEYPVLVSTADELAAALAQGGNVVLQKDIAADTQINIPAGVSVNLDMNGKTITAPAGATCAIQNMGTLTVTGNGTFEGSYTALYSNGNLTIENGTFAATTGFGVLIDNIYGTEASVAVINGGTFTGLGIYNPTDVTINGGVFNVGRDPDGATDDLSDEMTMFISPTFTGAPNTANVVLNGGTFNGDVYVYDDGITETVFVNNGATITGDVLDNA